MAIYHCTVKNISRGSGRSSVAAAAYRSGENILNERNGKRHDYTKKEGVIHSEIMAPEHAPAWATDRTKLWNEVEKSEVAKNARTCREIEIALPVELLKKQRLDLVKDYVKRNFVNHGMVADISFHDKNDGNPHVHIGLTTRPFEQDGSWGQKAKKEYMLDKNGNKQFTAAGNVKSRKIDTTDWNQTETLERWRTDWAESANRALERAGSKERIDHRSNEDRGIKELPSVHLGPEAHAMEKKGKRTRRGDRNKKIAEINKDLSATNAEIEKLTYALDFFKRAETSNQPPEPQIQLEPSNSTPKTETPVQEPPTHSQPQHHTVLPVISKSQKRSVKKSVGEWRDICKHKEDYWDRLDKSVADEMRKVNHEIHALHQPYIKEAATIYFTAKYKDQIDSNSRDIEQYNKDFDAHKNINTYTKFIHSKKYNDNAANLVIRKNNIDNTQADLQKAFSSDVANAIIGKYPSHDNLSSNKIETTAKKLATEKDPKYQEKLKPLIEKQNKLFNISKSTNKEKSQYKDLGRKLKQLKPTQQLELPTANSGRAARADQQRSTKLIDIDQLVNDSKITGINIHFDDTPEIDWGMLTEEQVRSKIAQLEKDREMYLGR